ncbi:MAG: hypothetical protein J0M04_01335 [Verrucomicrobia bacterium]|nr:hypothetical protein [Verrucomicrobiota bacterium]
MNTTSSNLARSVLAGAFAFAGQAQAANVVVNSSFDNDSGNPITTTNGTRTISGWGSIHLYNHTYNGTEGPKLGSVGTFPAYGLNDDIVFTEGSGLSGTYKGVGSASQTVNLATALSAPTMTAIANGYGQFSFSSWMSGWSGDGNTVATRLRFFDATNGTGTLLGTFTLDRGVTTNQVNTADKIVNPGGANNATSMTDPDWWALYESQNTVPTSAQSIIVDFVAGTGHVNSGGNDWYADHVVVDIVPESSVALLGGLGALGLLRRRRD